MKKGTRNLMGAIGLSLATLFGSGCGDRSVNPVDLSSKNNTNVEEFRERIRRDNLEGRVYNGYDDSRHNFRYDEGDRVRLANTRLGEQLGDIETLDATVAYLSSQKQKREDAKSTSGGSAKLASDGDAKLVDTIQHYDRQIGDFDGDHDIDLDDFFLFADHFGTNNQEYSLDGDEEDHVGFDDFFIFADNFGRTHINFNPVATTLVSEPDGEVDIGDGVVLRGFGSDRNPEDELRYVWDSDGDSLEVNGGEYRFSSDVAGEFDLGFVVRDNYGGESERIGKRVVVNEPNYAPVIDNFSVNNDTLETGETLTASFNVSDRNGDSLTKRLYVDGNLVDDDNDNSFSRVVSDVGNHVLTLEVDDGNGGITSRDLSYVVNEPEPVGPVLSFSDKIEFDQWLQNEPEGNTHSFDLDDCVDRDVNWSYELIGNNEFEHTRENTAPFGNWLLYPYRANALRLTLNGDNVLEIDPVANYNGDDHGLKTIRFTATDSDGNGSHQDVEVYVRRTPEFDNHYDDVVSGGGWDNPPEYFYIWTGRGTSEDGESLENAVGPYATEEEIAYFVRLAETFPTVSDFFNPLEIRYTDNFNELMSIPSGSFYISIDNYGRGGATYPWPLDNYEWVGLCINSMTGNDRFWPVCLHEMFDHGVGMDHPWNYIPDLEYVTIFTGWNRLEEIPNRDKAVIDSFYETKQYR